MSVLLQVFPEPSSFALSSSLCVDIPYLFSGELHRFGMGAKAAITLIFPISFFGQETRFSLCIEDDLQLKAILPLQPPSYWAYRYAPPLPSS